VREELGYVINDLSKMALPRTPGKHADVQKANVALPALLTARDASLGKKKVREKKGKEGRGRSSRLLHSKKPPSGTKKRVKEVKKVSLGETRRKK